MDVLIELNELQIIKKNEGSADEPFLWVAYVAADGTTINPANPSGNSVRIHVPSGQHGNLGPAADDADLHESIAIPLGVGRFHTTLSRGPLGAIGEMVSLVAIIVVAIEEDATKDSAIQAGHDTFVNAIRKQLTQAVRSLSPLNPEQVTSAVEKKVNDTIKSSSISVFSFMPITSLLDIGGILDPDDLVGSTVLGPFSYRQIASAGPNGIPLQVNLEKGNREEGTYRLVGRIRRRPIVPFGALFGPGKGSQHFVAGLEFQAFVDLWNKLGKQTPPVDMIDFETFVEGGKRKFAGVFSPGKGGQHFVAGLEFQAFVDLWNKLGKQTPPVDMIDFETFVEGGKRKFAGVFSPGKGGQHFVAGLEFQAFVDLWNKLGKQTPPVDMRRFKTYVEGGKRKFAGVFSPGKGGQHFVSGLGFQAFVDLWIKLGKQTPPVDMIDFETFVEDGKREFAGLFTPGKGGQAFFWGLDFEGLIDEWIKRGSQNPPADLLNISVG